MIQKNVSKYLFFCLACLSLSCTSSKVTTKVKCTDCLNQNKGILVVPLSWDHRFQVLPISKINRMEEEILRLFTKQKISKIQLIDQLDYELLSSNIQDINDSIQRSKLNSELGYAYLLNISLLDASASEEWDFESQEEQEAIFPLARAPLAVKAIVRVLITRTKDGITIADHRIQTRIGELPISSDDEGTYYGNFGSVPRAVFIAVKKGVKATLKDCRCNLFLKPS